MLSFKAWGPGYGYSTAIVERLRDLGHKVWTPTPTGMAGYATDISDPSVIEDAAESCGVPIAALVVYPTPTEA